ncbi:MAG: 16S rRNA (cytosine(967)-C(5))-methyltransferase RsmB [Wenzhouxiangellaceae bacterium]|nr:16S rRNA (cytosine(967)-C(5))-methyltransferase RsmB [Wenzhouxiangellaceae bacterium]
MTSKPGTQGAAARLASARALVEVFDRRRNLGAALSMLDRDLGHGQDRAQVRRLCNRVLRDYPALNWRLEQLLKKALPRQARVVHFLLLSAIDELREDREPTAAIVHASVAAARLAGQHHLSGLVNAVLRNHQRQALQLDQSMPADPALQLGYPDWLLEALRRDWPQQWHQIAIAGNQPPPLWLRVNRRRSSVARLQQELAAAGCQGSVDSRFPDAIKLEHHARISSLPGFDQGHFSVQDAGAQMAARLLEPGDGQRVLDACAAPGGKAAHLLECAELDLTAVEMDPERAGLIAGTFERLGLSGNIVIGDAARPEQWWDGTPFDRILIDAPCSATGVLRRHPDIRWLRRAGDIDESIALQRRMLQALWPLLKPGGLLVYATCSILHGENRDQARTFLENNADAELQTAMVADQANAGTATAADDGIADLDWLGIEVQPGRQILPGNLDRDGFYYLCLRRMR